MKKAGIMMAAILICTGCAGMGKTQAPLNNKAKEMLASGIRHYEDGSYQETIADLQGALDTGLSSTSDQVKAHKYLAFTYCISNRETLCRQEFSKALAIDPKFDLAPAEAGHPMWGNVFRSVKKNFH